jgi:hypothetical protein
MEPLTLCSWMIAMRALQELKRHLVAALDQLGQRPAGTQVPDC